jgi:chromosome segregation protein
VQVKRLRLSGFKSFVEPTELRIEPGLTGVVGPNGCGKSNLLEAIRWVMGESSAKSMRGGGMDDVIFSGTATRPSRDFAEVTLHCDTEGALVAGLADLQDGDELEVIRRIERGSGSAYRANGRDVRAKDVSLIFADAATGPHSPALVSQGKIAHIIAAKPTERRAMLEEAAGIAGLHVRRKDAEQRLKATETNLEQLSQIVSAMDARADALQRQARAATKYRQLTSDIRSAEARLIYARWRDAATAAEQARSEAEEADQAVQKAQAELEGLASSQISAATALAAHRVDAQKQRDALATVNAHFARLESEENAVRARLDDLARQQASVEADKVREGELGAAAHAAIAELEAESKDAAAQRAAQHQKRGPLLEDDQRAQNHLRDVEITLAQLRAQAANEAADHRIAEAAQASALAQHHKSAAQLARIVAECQTMGDADALQADLIRAQNEAAVAEAAIKDAELALTSAQYQREQSATALHAQEAVLASAHAELSALLAEFGALESSINAHRHDGERLIDHIEAAVGFEAAIAAALGDDLNAGTDASAVRSWHVAAPVSGDPPPIADGENLSHYVSAPPLLARRLNQIIVLPADDGRPLKTGQRLVTLDGQMRRWDGYATSGDGALASEELRRRNRLAALTETRPAAEAHFAQAQQLHSQITADLAAATAAADQARRDMAAADHARRAALRAADQAQNALERWKAALTLLQQQRRDAEGLLAEAEAHVAQHKAQLAALPDLRLTEAALAEAEQNLLSSRRLASESRDRLADHDTVTAQLRERQAVISAEIKGWRSRAGEAVRRVQDLDRRAATLADDVTMLAHQPEKLARDKALVEKRQTALTAALTEAETAEAEAEAAYQAIEAVLDPLRETVAQLREIRATAVASRDNAEMRRIDMGRLSGESFRCPPPLLPHHAGFDPVEVGDAAAESSRHEQLISAREQLGPVNLVAADELATLDEERGRNAAEISDLQQAVNHLRGSIGNLNREGRTRLLAAFNAVNGHFQRLFTDLFGGGSAHLAWIDNEDPLQAGLEIMAQPPGKRLGSLALLSGGEQALTAVALIFGLFLTNPAPLCVLDEVDAPLDDANIERFCDLLDQMVRETDTRYLIVTHNAVTMARMHRLYGVTMVERGVSRLVSVDLGGAEDLLAEDQG